MSASPDRLQSVAHVGPDQGAPHIEFLGLPFCTLSGDEVVSLIIDRSSARYRYVVTPNAYHVAAVHNDREHLLPIYQSAWLSLCDSRIVRALSVLDHQTLPLVCGSDLVPALLAKLESSPAKAAGCRVLVVGPATSAEAILRRRYPHVSIDVMPAPLGLGHRPDLQLEVARACLARQWDVLLLCLGCPVQEQIAWQLGLLGRSSGVALCVGAAIDFLTGQSVRAPRWLQRLGLEWAYRLAREPSRLWRRYLIESPRVLRIYLATRRRSLRRAGSSQPTR